jgi:transcriptional regulator with GAF, ATPase, and Fis domain
LSASKKQAFTMMLVRQEQEFKRAGGGKTIQVDVRVTAAAHRNPDEAAGLERFRFDLYSGLYPLWNT